MHVCLQKYCNNEAAAKEQLFSTYIHTYIKYVYIYSRLCMYVLA